jgi:hypothetical protein
MLVPPICACLACSGTTFTFKGRFTLYCTTRHNTIRQKLACLFVYRKLIDRKNTHFLPTQTTPSFIQLYSNKMHLLFIIKSTRYYNLYFLSCILPLHVSTRVSHLQGAQCKCLAKVIVDYNLLKLR